MAMSNLRRLVFCVISMCALSASASTVRYIDPSPELFNYKRVISAAIQESRWNCTQEDGTAPSNMVSVTQEDAEHGSSSRWQLNAYPLDEVNVSSAVQVTNEWQPAILFQDRSCNIYCEVASIYTTKDWKKITSMKVDMYTYDNVLEGTLINPSYAKRLVKKKTITCLPM